MNRWLCLCLATLACLPGKGVAQQNPKNIDDIQIVFEKSKEIVLPLEDKPQTNRLQALRQDTLKRDFSAVGNGLAKPTNVLDLKPRVLNYAAPTEGGQRPNYLKLGLGNYLTTHLEGFYSHGSKSDYIAAKVLHLNSALGSERWMATGINQLHTFGTYKALGGRLSADLLVENNRNTLYAFIPPSAEKGDIRISNLRTGFRAAYQTEKTNKYKLDLGLAANAITSFGDQRSYFAQLSGNYSVTLGDVGILGLSSNLAVNKISSSVSRNVAFFDVGGSLTRSFGGLTVKPSLTVLAENDSIDKKNVHIYPGLEASYALNTATTLFGGVTSGYSQNLFFYQAKVNPWLGNISQFSYTNMPLAVGLGVRVAKARYQLEGSGGLKQFKNYLLFAPIRGDSARMMAINLRDTAVTLTYLQISGSYRFSDKISAETGLQVQAANSSFRSEIPNVPLLTWRVAPTFGQGGFSVSPALVVMSSYDLLTPRLTTVKSGIVADLSLKASYLISQRLDVNLDLYNLANNKPYLYYGYRQRGIMAVLGATLKF